MKLKWLYTLTLVAKLQILGMNLAVGIDGSIGKPMIREGQDIHVYVRRSLRDVFRKIPTFSLEVKVCAEIFYTSFLQRICWNCTKIADSVICTCHLVVSKHYNNMLFARLLCSSWREFLLNELENDWILRYLSPLAVLTLYPKYWRFRNCHYCGLTVKHHFILKQFLFSEPFSVLEYYWFLV